MEITSGSERVLRVFSYANILFYKGTNSGLAYNHSDFWRYTKVYEHNLCNCKVSGFNNWMLRISSGTSCCSTT